MKKRMTSVLPMLILALGLAMSCAPTTKLTRVWRDEAYQGHPRKILIIVVLKNSDVRKLVENEFVEQLRGRGIDAIAGYTVLPDTAALNKKVIIEKMNDLGTDSVLIARHVGDRSEQTPMEGADTLWYGNTGVQSPDVVYKDQYAVMQARLYDLKTEQPVWIASSETWLTSNFSDTMVIRGYIKAVLKSMTDQKILASTPGR
jgi:hypothetical protein